MNDFSIINGIIHADIVVKLVLLALFLMSLASWSVFFQKLSSFKVIVMKNKKFEKKFWSGVMLEDFYREVKAGSYKSIYGNLFTSAMEEWVLSDITQSVMAVEFIKAGVKERVITSIISAQTIAQERLQKGLNILSIITSTAPFVGLFGTVWGVMNSFKAIAGASSVTLASIAPGISEALFSTAIGLFVALPSVVFYMNLSKKIGEVSSDVSAFGMSIENVLSRELDNFSVKNYMDANK